MRLLQRSAGRHVPGLTSSERFHAHVPGAHVPVIFITAFGAPGTARGALEVGAATFLVRPFSERTLLERVERALRAA